MKHLEEMTNAELGAMMNECAGAVDKTLFQHTRAITAAMRPKFALLVFNDPKLVQYVGVCERADLIKAFRELADRLEREQDGHRAS